MPRLWCIASTDIEMRFMFWTTTHTERWEAWWREEAKRFTIHLSVSMLNSSKVSPHTEPQWWTTTLNSSFLKWCPYSLHNLFILHEEIGGCVFLFLEFQRISTWKFAYFSLLSASGRLLICGAWLCMRLSSTVCILITISLDSTHSTGFDCAIVSSIEIKTFSWTLARATGPTALYRPVRQRTTSN